MPQRKKHSSTRARRNRAATAATLTDAEPIDRSTWTAAQLRSEIDVRNADRSPEEKLSKAGGKAGMVDTLLDDDYHVPELPERPAGWHEQTQDWWRDVWLSPMSKEWHPESDWHNVYIAAGHYDDFVRGMTAVDRQKATVLFTKMCDFLGLNPYARRRLEWTIETAEAAKESGRRRREGAPAQPPGRQRDARPDPRAGLQVV